MKKQASLFIVFILCFLCSTGCSNSTIKNEESKAEVFATEIGNGFGLAFNQEGVLFATGSQDSKQVIWEISPNGEKKVFVEITEMGDSLAAAGLAYHSEAMQMLTIDAKENLWITTGQHGAMFMVTKDSKVSKIYLNSFQAINMQIGNDFPNGVAWDSNVEQLYIITSGPPSAYSTNVENHIKTLSIEQITDLEKSAPSLETMSNSGIPITLLGRGLLKMENTPLYFIGRSFLYKLSNNNKLVQIGSEFKNSHLISGTLDNQGNIYLSISINKPDKDEGEFTIVKMNPTGEYTTLNTGIKQPWGLAYNDGFLYVFDGMTKNIYKTKL